jgi:hypothetical protein
LLLSTPQYQARPQSSSKRYWFLDPVVPRLKKADVDWIVLWASWLQRGVSVSEESVERTFLVE